MRPCSAPRGYAHLGRGACPILPARSLDEVRFRPYHILDTGATSTQTHSKHSYQWRLTMSPASWNDDTRTLTSTSPPKVTACPDHGARIARLDRSRDGSDSAGPADNTEIRHTTRRCQRNAVSHRPEMPVIVRCYKKKQLCFFYLTTRLWDFFINRLIKKLRVPDAFARSRTRSVRYRCSKHEDCFFCEYISTRH
jgi:hypothetical protein